MCQSETNVWESLLLRLEFLLKWQSEFKTLLTFLVAFPVRLESANVMYHTEINAWQMERFLNPMHLVHVSIWWRDNRKHLKRGCEAREVIGQTFGPSHSNGQAVETMFRLEVGKMEELHFRNWKEWSSCRTALPRPIHYKCLMRSSCAMFPSLTTKNGCVGGEIFSKYVWWITQFANGTPGISSSKSCCVA